MPAWLKILIDLAIRFGSPFILSYLKEKIASLPGEVRAIIDSLIKGILDPQIPTPQARKAARAAFKDHCNGVGCQTNIKREGKVNAS